MAKLNQIVAVEKGTKTRTNKVISDLYKDLQKGAPLAGLTRTYQRKDDEGDEYPSEYTLVQITMNNVLENASKSWTTLADVVLTKEAGNTEATADVVVDGDVLLQDVPVGYLLFLEKLLTDVQTFVSKIPLLDPAEKWTYNPNSGAYESDTAKTAKTKNVPRNHVLAAATDKHPAQVKTYEEQVVMGYWSTTKLSGALPRDTVEAIKDRVIRLKDAVKFAREEANNTEVEQLKAGEAVFDYILGN